MSHLLSEKEVYDFKVKVPRLDFVGDKGFQLAVASPADKDCISFTAIKPAGHKMMFRKLPVLVTSGADSFLRHSSSFIVIVYDRGGL